MIAGGGPTGLLLALGLDHAGIACAVLDPQSPEQVLAAPFDGRALALMAGSRPVFEALGAWPALAPHAHPVWGVRVRDEATGAAVAYDAREVGEQPFSYGIENRVLRRVLLEVAQRRPAIALPWPARAGKLARRDDHMAVQLEDGRELGARLVIGADGRGSSLRALAGIACERRRYRQSALLFAVRHAAPHDDLVREFLRPAGPLALLPIAPDVCSVTWVERAEDAAQLLRAGPEALSWALIGRIGHVLGELELIGAPGLYPLDGQHARRYVAPRLALVGDAAHGVHPIHAQGFNLAVRDVAALVEVLADAARAGRDLGEPEALLRYERWRRADAAFVLGLTDGLNQLFSNDYGPLKVARGIGLEALARITPLRHAAMRRGMGLMGGLPRLARGAPL